MLHRDKGEPMTTKTSKKLYLIVTDLLYLFDPAGLNDICPEDEYTPEASMLLSQPELFTDEEKLAGGIYAVCAVSIGARNIAPVSDPLYAKLAKEILFVREVLQEKEGCEK